jgi:hypothetical protein
MQLTQRLLFIVSLFFGIVLVHSCSEPGPEPGKEMPENFQVFEPVTSDQSGVDFINQITETPDFHYFIYEGLYQGGGVAVGDFNKDGLEDLFFSGNMVPDRLYLNKGNMQFEDISESAGVADDKGWSMGVTVADVNNDGWLDIYVCKFLYDDNELRKNKLYINNGDLTFTEKAAEYKINDPGYSVHANFFDYDNDGHLDLYVANQPPNNYNYRQNRGTRIDLQYTDHLFHNNGDGTFTNLTEEAGVKNYSFSLSASTADLNRDGWLDIYVACDYEEPDFLYLNNGDGTFTNAVHDALRHMSNFSMGTDIADINNDGWLDIYTADMVADDNERLKTNMSGMNPQKFWGLANKGFHYQYMFNALQLNNGNGTYSEIAQLAGVSNTDWSWSSIFADFDNDGYKDLFVTNGYYRDMRNNDFRIAFNNFMEEKLAEAERKGIPNMQVNPLELIEKAPSFPIQNFIYSNNGDLTFTPRKKDWGLDYKGFSQGSAIVDLDNDGDLDIVTNNINDKASIFRNTTSDNQYNNYLRVKLEGDATNPYAHGATVTIFYGDQLQTQTITPVRGYQSSSETVAHFGLGMTTQVDKIVVQWPDQTETQQTDISANREITIMKKATKPASPLSLPPALLEDITPLTGLDFVHQENEFEDFAREILLPHRMSNLGPCLASADVNGDGLTDFFVGGASGYSGQLFLQGAGRKFEASGSTPWSQDKSSEDVGALFFDADGDGDDDLYVVSGGNDFEPGDKNLQDRLYLNDGKGDFSKSNTSLPTMLNSNSKAAAADFDGDGDQDLFIGGRQIPGKYGFPTRSYLLRNDNGRFIDITREAAPELVEAGMVTSVLWMDLDGDQDEDLVLAGEWMPVSFFQNDGGRFSNVTEKYGTANTKGWWNTLSKADLDGDGDLDLIAGNLGLNIKYKASEEEPFKLFVKDFDGNGSNDVYLGYYDHDGVCYPVRGRECSSQQLPYIKKEFPSYAAFAKAPIESVLGERMEGAVTQEVQLFANVWLENKNGRFEVHQLPNEAQIAPAFGIVPYDFTGDGNIDLLLAGNYYEREVETTRSDAGIGCLLAGDGKGNFRALHPTESGLKAYGDVRDLLMLKDDQENPLILIANNDGPMQVYYRNKPLN